MSLISVVHDFAVLYSTRIHQKDKRWSDGRLKYYEFNNKIEVLSEEQALVLVDFYPRIARNPLESGVFADGNTYCLPGGKMVIEFAEYLGCTERDVSKAFAKPNNPRIKREATSPESVLRPKTTMPVMVKSEHKNSPVIDRVRRVGLAKPKRQTRQSELTKFISPVRQTPEERLRKVVPNPPITPRILAGTNVFSRKLHAELGCSVETDVVQAPNSRKLRVGLICEDKALNE